MTDIDYLKLAVEVAQTYSKDPSTQNGAILVATNGQTVQWANQFPKGVKYTPERFERPLKYSFFSHSEAGVIIEAAKLGVSTLGATIYCPWYACDACARAIAQAGISRIVGLTHPDDETSKRWKSLCEVGDVILDEAGVERSYISTSLGLEILRDGKLTKI